MQVAAWPNWGQQFLLRVAVWFAQRQAERRAYRTRLQTLKQDRDLSKVIGFAGKTQ
jgi:preprotein translocase subunit SecA